MIIFFVKIIKNIRLILSNKHKVYWFSMVKEKGKQYENYGDILTPYLVSKLTDKKVIYFNPSSKLHVIIKHSIMIGSIIDRAKKKSIVWGSGVIRKNQKIENANFYAVRGPLTYERLIELGYKANKVFGDPALLMPKVFLPNVEKKYKYGIVPHYVDYDELSMYFKGKFSVKVINLKTLDVEKTTQEIIECECIVSTSLHGLIISDAYNIPNIWLKYSNNLAGDDIKFEDYFLSVERKGEKINKSELSNLEKIKFEILNKAKVQQVQKELLSVFPYKLKKI